MYVKVTSIDADAGRYSLSMKLCSQSDGRDLDPTHVEARRYGEIWGDRTSTRLTPRRGEMGRGGERWGDRTSARLTPRRTPTPTGATFG